MSDRKNILLIATGGTIASKKSDNGLKPQISPDELMQYIPQVKNICDFHAVQLLNLDSSNMEPKPGKMMCIPSVKIMKNTIGFVIDPRYGHNGIHCGGTFLYDTTVWRPAFFRGQQTSAPVERVSGRVPE